MLAVNSIVLGDCVFLKLTVPACLQRLDLMGVQTEKNKSQPVQPVSEPTGYDWLSCTGRVEVDIALSIFC